jgi:uncharacterized delta-60 repeat protein
MTQERRRVRRTGVRRLIAHYSILFVTLLFSVASLTTLQVSAGAADLDPSFDNDGMVVTNNDQFDEINDLVIQPDGKIVVAGETAPFDPLQSHSQIIVARYNADGSLDPTFGNNGIVTTAVGDQAIANAATLQPDGKIVVVGSGGNMNQTSFVVVRYNPNGSLDGAFGNGGIVTTSVTTFARLHDVAIQPDGKIVAAGDAFIPDFAFFTNVFTVARYNPDGSLDTTFDGDGVSQAVVGVSPQTAVAWGLALQNDQKIVLAGTCISSFSEFCLARYNSDGSADSTFDGDGLVVTGFESDFGASADDVVVQPDGKILAGGARFGDGLIDGVLARYNGDGSLDSTFEGDGKVITSGFQFSVHALALQADGRIVAVGQSIDTFSLLRLTVARYTASGAPDNTFAGGNLATPAFAFVHSRGNAVAVQTDGRIVAGGLTNFGSQGGSPIGDFGLIRLGEPVNRAPVVTITGPPSGSAFAVNTPVNFTASFTDDTNDAHQIIWRFVSVPQPGPASVAVAGATPGPVTTTHTFTEPGVYTIELHVLDADFLSGIATTIDGVPALVVIYDPNGPSVSGGGWIDSPPGALVAMPATTGKANFAFVARYQDGANVPTGNTQFRFSAGDLSFQSTGYEWLVVSGRFVVCKGAGTINGSNYRFMLTGIDGDQPGGGGQDKLRIRIWSDSGGLVYDNQLNAPETDAPTTPLGGGNIAFHR